MKTRVPNYCSAVISHLASYISNLRYDKKTWATLIVQVKFISCHTPLIILDKLGCGSVKEGLVITGILIMLIGLVSISRSNIQQKESNTQSVKVENKWSISDSFQKGQTLTLNFLPHADWSLHPYPDLGEPAYSKHFMVNIKNTETNDYTLIKVILVPPEGTVPGPPYGFLLSVYGIEVVHHGAITIEDYPYEITGIAKDDGLYRIDCSLIPDNVLDTDLEGNLWPHQASPPPEFTLDKITIETKNPYRFLLPVGATLSIVGVIISIWGAKSKERRITRKRVRR